MNIPERLTLCRKLMQDRGVDVLIVPTADPHLSEYVPADYQLRPWLTGFTGSAGRAVIAADEAWLWTDGRYAIQAREQLAGTGVVPMSEERDVAPGVFLSGRLGAGAVVAVSGYQISQTDYERLERNLSPRGIRLRDDVHVVDELSWDRPAAPQSPIWEHDVAFSGVPRTEKIAALRKELRETSHVEGTVLTKLDDIAWLFNLRGGDVPHNPVFVAYAYIDASRAILFVDRSRLEADAARSLQADGIEVQDYSGFAHFRPAPDSMIHLDPDSTNRSVFIRVDEACGVVTGSAPVARLKAVKNDAEVRGIIDAHRRDGVAMVRFLMQMETPDRPADEGAVAELLRTLRASGDRFVSESFSTIAGYRDHGAIVHYSATAESSHALDGDGLLLVDSGGQYRDGTTDITRTILLGETARQEWVRDYTMVLRAHIALATASFPKHATGQQLDSIARRPLWDDLDDYRHGTGHGVGAFLSVHESPPRFSPNAPRDPLEANMLVSIEPGLYRDGSHGVRIENLAILRPAVAESAQGATAGRSNQGAQEFLHFEVVTLCPLDRRLIDVSILTDDERGWVDAYHRRVLEELGPLVLADERVWLASACAPLANAAAT